MSSITNFRGYSSFLCLVAFVVLPHAGSDREDVWFYLGTATNNTSSAGLESQVISVGRVWQRGRLADQSVREKPRRYGLER